MAQKVTGIYSILNLPRIYNILQGLMGQSSLYKLIVDKYIRPKKGDRVLDIGCGTAKILDFLPDVKYFGFDLSEKYINAAQVKYGSKGVFKCAQANHLNLEAYGKFDIVILIGILHHLDDKSVKNLFEIIRDELVDGGRIIAVDGVFVKGQNPFAKIILSFDRGQNIRTAEGYESLANSFFKFTKVSVLHKTFMPYTYAILECTK